MQQRKRWLLLLVGAVVLVLLVLFIVNKGGKPALGSAEQKQEATKQVVDQLRKHMELPVDTQITVATIVDVNALRKQNAFYNKAENGDRLILTQDRAILFSATKDRILDMMPIEKTSPPPTK